MIQLSSEEIELIKILSILDSSKFDKHTNLILNKIGKERLETILQSYHKENTINLRNDLTEKFEKLGINKEDGKSAIANARRLGCEI